MKSNETFKYAADTSDMVLVLRGGNQSVETKQRIDKIVHIISLVIIYAFLTVMGVLIVFPF